MTVNALNLGMNASSWGAYSQKLTTATKAKLDELNIPYTNSTTESEGKMLLRNAQESEKAKQEGNNSNSNASSKDPLLEKAKKLAKKIGISTDENTPFETLISKIETTLEEQIKANSTNSNTLEQLKTYSRQLASIQAESMGSSGLDSTNQALMMSLEMLGQYNKNTMLG